MSPKTPFNDWILSKINAALSKEGCEIKGSDYVLEGAKSVVQDAFGFVYEVRVSTVGRINLTTIESEDAKTTKPMVQSWIERVK